MTTTARPYRIYLCSDYHDTMAERQFLHEEVFPKLRAQFSKHHIELEIIDPWQWETPSYDDIYHLKRRLEEIDRRSIFVVLLGERYGPVVSPPETVRVLYPELSNLPERPLLEWEIHHALSARAGEATPRADRFIYVRNVEVLTRIPEEIRKKYQGNATDQSAQLAISQPITASASCSRTYGCEWNQDRQCFQSFTELAEWIEHDVVESMIDRYKIMSLDQIGRGGMGEVFRAEDPSFDRSIGVALKFPRFDDSVSVTPKLDDNVQFTVYRPRVVAPEKWNTLLAFAHLAEKRPDDPATEPDPMEEVERQAEQALGDQASSYRATTQDSTASVPQEGELTFVPNVPGIQFNPPRQTVQWLESVHRVDFRMWAGADLDETTARGNMTVYLGCMIIADIPLSLKISRQQAESAPTERTSARPYRKIFASYSHKDLPIVEQMEKYAKTMGDRYVRDWLDLRSGELWDQRLLQLIEEADVFQLFWSSNSMTSNFVRQEWEHALSLHRPNFVRPTYWEDPLPRSPEQNLPPDELLSLHFERLAVGDETQAPVHMAPEPAAPVAEATKVIVACAKCSAQFRTTRANLGKRSRCPQCAAIFILQEQIREPRAKSRPTPAGKQRSAPPAPIARRSADEDLLENLLASEESLREVTASLSPPAAAAPIAEPAEKKASKKWTTEIESAGESVPRRRAKMRASGSGGCLTILLLLGGLIGLLVIVSKILLGW